MSLWSNLQSTRLTRAVASQYLDLLDVELVVVLRFKPAMVQSHAIECLGPAAYAVGTGTKRFVMG